MKATMAPSFASLRLFVNALFALRCKRLMCCARARPRTGGFNRSLIGVFGRGELDGRGGGGLSLCMNVSKNLVPCCNISFVCEPTTHTRLQNNGGQNWRVLQGKSCHCTAPRGRLAADEFFGFDEVRVVRPTDDRHRSRTIATEQRQRRHEEALLARLLACMHLSCVARAFDLSPPVCPLFHLQAPPPPPLPAAPLSDRFTTIIH